jgi:uncharacterized membrane protein YgaE (UPF0421/DUF939 family)
MGEKDSDEVGNGEASSDKGTLNKISPKEYIHRLLYPNDVKPNWNSALYMLAALIVVFIISQLLKLGNVTAAFILSGVYISLILTVNLPIRVLIRLDIIMIIIMGLTFFTAAVGHINPWIGLLFLLFWIFLNSSLNILGKLTGTIGFIGLLFYILASLVIVNNQSTAIEWGLWAFLGAFIGSMVILIPKILRKDKSIPQIVASCFIPNADMNTIIKARMLLKKTHPTPKISSMIEIARLLVTTKLIAYGIESNLKGKAGKILKEFLTEVDKLSQEVANAVITDKKNLNLNITVLNRKINDLTSVTELDNATSLIVLKNMDTFKEIFEKSQKILEGDLILDIPPLLFSSQASSLEKLKANFNLGNIYIRHGTRLALALGLGFMVTLLSISYHALWITIDAFWITITILFVLKADISSSVEMSIVRVIATLVGVILAILISGILIGLGFSIAIYGFIVLMLVIISAYKKGYPFLVAITMFLIFLLIITLPGNLLATGLARIVDTIIGSAIALAVGYLILPSKLKVDLKQQVVMRLASNTDYINNAIIPAFENTISKKKVNLANNEMLFTHNNLKAAINKVTNSFNDVGEDIKVLNSIADANDRLSRDLSALDNKINISKNTHPIWEPTTIKIEQILTDLKNTVETGKDLQPLPDSDLTDEIEEIKIESGDMDSKIIFEYLEWIISDVNGLYDSIKHAKDNGIFKKYENL